LSASPNNVKIVMNEDEMDGACSTRGLNEKKFIQILV
jgi:hypothetical protein